MGHAQNFQYPLFFFNDTATTEIYTLSLHDALPIYQRPGGRRAPSRRVPAVPLEQNVDRSEEHTSELQSHVNLVCRLLLAKIKTYTTNELLPKATRQALRMLVMKLLL